MTHKEKSPETTSEKSGGESDPIPEVPPQKGGKVTEIGGPKGPEPTRYGDWEKNGRCIDF